MGTRSSKTPNSALSPTQHSDASLASSSVPHPRRKSLYPVPTSESAPSPPQPVDMQPAPVLTETLNYQPLFPGDFQKPHSYPPPTEMVFRNYHGLRIAAKVWGQRPVRGRARAGWIRVIALHGWLDNAATWDTMAPVLLSHLLRYYPSHRATLVCIDVPGHGLSDHRHRQVEYSDWRCVADVEAVREQLGWGRFHGVGHSMGCQILSMYAGTYPTRLHTLSLIDSLGPWSFPDILHPPLLAEYVRDTKRAGAKRKPLYPTVHDALVARSKGSRIPLTYEGARVLCARGLMEVELSGEGGDPGPAVETGPKYVMKTGGEKELTEGGQKRRGSVGERAAATKDDEGGEGDEEDEDEDEEDAGGKEEDGKFEKKVWYTWRTDPSLILSSGIRPSESVSVEFLKRIKCPTLVVLATEGYFVPTIQRDGEDPEKQRLQTRLRGLRGGEARVVIMEGSHHLHLESRFRECGELVADFLEDRAGARARLGASSDEVAAGKVEEWVEGATAGGVMARL